MYTLPAREAEVISMLFGLTCEPMTVGEIARRFGITHGRVRQTVSKAMAKLRHPSRTLVLRVSEGARGRASLIDVASKRGSIARDQRIFEKWLSNVIACAHCGKSEFASRSDEGGRPRKYCASKCRQAAYRARRSRASSP